MANTSPRHMPVLGNVHPIKIENFDIFSWRHFTARSSFYIINWYGYPRGSHEKYLKEIVSSVFEIRKYWRIFCDVISLLALVFIVSFDRPYNEVSTKKYWKVSIPQFLWLWLYLQKAMYRPCDLDRWPMEVKLFSWIDYDPISVLYKFQMDISTNSREIKYQNMGIGLLHVKRNTRQKWR